MPSREEIKAWLKATQTKRSDLAARLHVTENTVNSWLSNKPIPLAKQEIITQLMAESESNERVTIEGTVNLSDEKMKALVRLSAKYNGDVEKTLAEALLALAEKLENQ